MDEDQEQEPNRIIRLWRELDEAMEEIFGDVWEIGKWIIGVAIIIGLCKLIFN